MGAVTDGTGAVNIDAGADMTALTHRIILVEFFRGIAIQGFLRLGLSDPSNWEKLGCSVRIMCKFFYQICQSKIGGVWAFLNQLPHPDVVFKFSRGGVVASGHGVLSLEILPGKLSGVLRPPEVRQK